jgi:hypothetical protein
VGSTLNELNPGWFKCQSSTFYKIKYFHIFYTVID